MWCSKILFIIFILATAAFGVAPATPVTVSGVTVASGVVTVTTSSAHGLAAGQGFCDLGSSVSADIKCATVATVPTTTTFTYADANALACSSSCGTNQPGKLFILGAITPLQQQGTIQLSFCVWTYTTNGTTRNGATSACAASAQENSAIASGTTIEYTFTVNFPANWTLAKVDIFATDMQASMQAALAGGTQPGAVQGRFCDSVGCN